MKNTLAVILAGGKGTRLEPLTRDRAKPAVPFGGLYRIIDFALSNCLNSDFRRVLMLTQYKAMSLDRHINQGWRHYFNRELGEFIDVVPPQQRIDEQWYQGTADAVYQNIYVLEKERPDYVVILAGDHIYKMNYKSMVQYHLDVGADVTVGALRVDPVEARQFGVMEVDANQRIIGFEEKVPNPKTIPGDPDHCLGSMGIYVFTPRGSCSSSFAATRRARQPARLRPRHHPRIIDTHKVYAFPFRDENRKSDAYWRDVGTLDAYFEANMDLITVDPLLNLYDEVWPIRTFQQNLPPPKFVFGSRGEPTASGRAIDSIVCQGTIVSGGLVERCVVGPRVRVNSYAHVERFDPVRRGRCRPARPRPPGDHRQGVKIPPGIEIGYDLELDRRRGFTVSDNGIVVIAKGDGLEHMVGPG
jgi:glucose-1-phosphate adenylyltransferase